MNKILLTNDDGIDSLAIQVLKLPLSDLGDVTIVAPKIEKSWCGKEITRFGEFIVEFNELGYSVQGTPADCVLIGAFHIMEKKPDLVISGINVGANAGNSFILSSGTVGAAMEAALLGIPAIAISILIPGKHGRAQDINSFDEKFFEIAIEITKKMSKLILETEIDKLPSNLFIINIPHNATKETKIKITSVGDAHYGSIFRELKEKEEASKKFFKFGARNPRGLKFGTELKDSDIRALLIERNISITPISLNLTGDVESTKDFFKSIL